MRLRGTTNDKNGDDLYHLLSILLVIVVSIIAWGIQSYRDSLLRRVDIVELLDILNDAVSHSLIVNQDDETEEVQTSFSLSKRSHARTLISINSVDSATLESLPVFGPVLASRTIKFRNSLGGFVSVTQLREVYGMDSLGYNKIADMFFIDSTLIDRICVDTADFKSMLSHPYLDYNTTKKIFRNRKHHDLNDLDSLKIQHFVDKEVWHKIKPYLKICSIH